MNRRLFVAWSLAVTVALSACGVGVPDGAARSPEPSVSPTIIDPPEAIADPRPAHAPTRTPRPAARPSSPGPSPAASTPTTGGGEVGVRYAFPVRPASASSYGRDHHDYPATDIFAACRTPVVSPVSGTVDEVSRRDDWDPDVNDGATRGGLSVSIVGDDGVRYYGSHYETIRADVRSGLRVAAGEALGTVGRTGSARPTPCHLHFGISPPCGQGDWEVRRGVVHPWPYLDAWRAGRDLSPADEVARWRAGNGELCAHD